MRIVRAAGVVLEGPHGSRGRPRVRVGDAGEVGLRVDDLKGGGVDGVDGPARVVVRARGDGGTYPSYREWSGVVGGCCVCETAGGVVREAVVVNGLGVLVRVPEENTGEGGGAEAADDRDEERGWIRCCAAAARGDVADDPDALIKGFGGGELGDEEGEDAAVVRVREVVVVVRVWCIPEIWNSSVEV